MKTTDPLFQLLMELPPKLDAIKHLLNRKPYTREDISEIFCMFADKCFCEYSRFIEQYGRNPLDEEIHSSYIFPLCELLLEYGLDPNYVFGQKDDESNIMYAVYWIDKPYVAADTLKLLLDSGGDPLLEVDGETIWHLSDFDIWFDVSHGFAQEEEYQVKFDCRFHFWLVLQSFLSPNKAAFRDHTLYTYRVVQMSPDHRELQTLKAH